MKIRTQLVLAFFLLAILPLSGIVLYSYASSLAAVRAAVEEESRALTEEMDERLDSVRRDLHLRFASLSEVPFATLLEPGEEGPGAEPLADRLVLAMGDVAPLIESLEWVPAPPAPPAPRAPEAPDPPLTSGAVAAAPSVPTVPAVPGVPPVRPSLGSAPEDEHRGAVVIDVPRILAELDSATKGAGEMPDGAALGLAMEVLGSLAERLEVEQERLAAEQERLALELERAAEEGELGTAGLARVERAMAARAEAQRAVTRKLEGAIEAKRRLTQAELKKIEERHKEQRLLLGEEFQVPVTEDGEVVGHVKACVASRNVLQDVLMASVRGEGEVPFAIDREGTVYTADEEGRALVEELELETDADGMWRPAGRTADDWVVATSEEEASGLTFGIARPIRQSLAQVRRTAARNFGYGLGLIVLGLVGIQPLSRRMSRQLETLAQGAERIAQGDLQTRLPVRGKSEFGRVADAFNRMARDLSTHHERLLQEERLRKEREIEERLLRAEYLRKSEELEEARRFQLSLLPKELPDHAGLEIAVAMTTATEVGGDFYDFQTGVDGRLTVAVGDATGHGARAGTMVTVIKSLFSAWTGAGSPGSFLEEANRAIKRMDLGRMAMALTLVRFHGRRMTVASAGMPPVLVHRCASGEVEEVVLAGMPLGGLDPTYAERALDLTPGDTVLLLSDGLPELPDAGGDPLGYPAVREGFGAAAGRAPGDLQEVIAELEAAARRWCGECGPSDDRTYVVVRVREADANREGGFEP